MVNSVPVLLLVTLYKISMLKTVMLLLLLPLLWIWLILIVCLIIMVTFRLSTLLLMLCGIPEVTKLYLLCLKVFRLVLAFMLEIRSVLLVLLLAVVVANNLCRRFPWKALALFIIISLTLICGNWLGAKFPRC